MKEVIRVSNVTKNFIIPHEKIDTLKSAFVQLFKKKSYEKFSALSDISFTVSEGEFFGIIGGNGSGKSTLLKILAGIYLPDAGHIKVHGLISPFLELGIGFNPELSGRDNIYINASFLGLTKKEIIKIYDSIVDFAGVERFIDQKLKNYSSGMAARLAFSVSIHSKREIILLDEALAVGDTAFQEKCIQIINKYREEGRTIIFVTHDMEVLKKYATNIMYLKDGKIVNIGKPEVVIPQYIQSIN